MEHMTSQEHKRSQNRSVETLNSFCHLILSELDVQASSILVFLGNCQQFFS